jgi:hypothetical protein
MSLASRDVCDRLQRVLIPGGGKPGLGSALTTSKRRTVILEGVQRLLTEVRVAHVRLPVSLLRRFRFGASDGAGCGCRALS